MLELKLPRKTVIRKVLSRVKKKSIKRTALTEEEKVGAKKRYEEERQRKFQRGWQEDRPWLDFVDGLMYCSWFKNENVANKVCHRN